MLREFAMAFIGGLAGLAIGFLAGLRYAWWGDLKFWKV